MKYFKPISTLVASLVACMGISQNFSGPYDWTGTPNGPIRLQSTHAMMLKDGSLLIFNKGGNGVTQTHGEPNHWHGGRQKIYNCNPGVLLITPEKNDWSNFRGDGNISVRKAPLFWSTGGNGFATENAWSVPGEEIDCNIYCSSHLLLPDRAGSAIFFGGDEIVETASGEVYEGDSGANHVFKYTPNFENPSDGWEKLNSMKKGRWYPTSIMLASGSIMTVSGTGAWINPPGRSGFEQYPLGYVTGIEMTSVWEGGDYTSYLPWSMLRTEEPQVVVDPALPVYGEDSPDHWFWGDSVPMSGFYPFLHVIPSTGEFAETGEIFIAGTRPITRSMNTLNHQITRLSYGIEGPVGFISVIYPSTALIFDEEAGWHQYLVSGGGVSPYLQGNLDISPGSTLAARFFLGENLPKNYESSSTGNVLNLEPKRWYSSLNDTDHMEPMNVPRRNLHLVPLPDLTFGAFGGSAIAKADFLPPFASAENAFRRPQRCPEIYDPVTNKWTIFGSKMVNGQLEADPTSAGSSKVDRPYHQIAMLLPTGQILNAGGEPVQRTDGLNDHQQFCIFDPPYMSIPNPPTLNGAVADQSTLFYNSEFPVPVDVAPGRDVKHAVMVTLESRTHGYGFGQKMIKLRPVTTIKKDITGFLTPKHPTVAPPGWYMIFVMDSEGAVSKATIVRLCEPYSKRPMFSYSVEKGKEDWENDVTLGEDEQRALNAMIHGDGYEQTVGTPERGGRLRIVSNDGVVSIKASTIFPDSVLGKSIKLRLESRTNGIAVRTPVISIVHTSNLLRRPEVMGDFSPFAAPRNIDRLDSQVIRWPSILNGTGNGSTIRSNAGPGEYEITITWEGLKEDEWIEIDELRLGGYQSDPE